MLLLYLYSYLSLPKFQYTHILFVYRYLLKKYLSLELMWLLYHCNKKINWSKLLTTPFAQRQLFYFTNKSFHQPQIQPFPALFSPPLLGYMVLLFPLPVKLHHTQQFAKLSGSFLRPLVLIHPNSGSIPPAVAA